jgi:4'-phosphopantetheinyl transferase
MTEIVVARLDAGAEETRSLESCLSDAERERAARFRFERDRRRFIVARARLREELAARLGVRPEARLGVRPEAVRFAYGDNGKPRLADHALQFSVSHCDDVALFAFSKTAEVGVDIEAIRPVREADAIAVQFFSPLEHAGYAALAPRDRLLGFFRVWTRKEAYVKALGVGFSMALERFDLSVAPRGWRVHSFFPLPGFIASLACHHG